MPCIEFGRELKCAMHQWSSGNLQARRARTGSRARESFPPFQTRFPFSFLVAFLFISPPLELGRNSNTQLITLHKALTTTRSFLIEQQNQREYNNIIIHGQAKGGAEALHGRCQEALKGHAMCRRNARCFLQAGVLSVSQEGDKITVVGEGIDSVALTRLLRKKMGNVELELVTIVEEKKEEKKVKVEAEVKNNIQPVILPHHYYYGQSVGALPQPLYYHADVREPSYDPDSCSIM
ncbi:hypothetical protein KFK09_028628 [Dendrobium nobile]|uniref:Uncharacterized protein n=1 Tax=Dendrobium nobile TaxID=94219 RepID=A0A8T3A3T5_DENNO|nr:hypothetical protein KFK09_028628 [Dendrobium nobile]